MSDSAARPAPAPTRSRRLLDAVQYAVALLALVTALLAVASAAVGLGALGVKWGLFVAGTLHLGYASVLLWRGSRAQGLASRGLIARFRRARRGDDGGPEGGSAPGADAGGDPFQPRRRRDRGLREPTAFQRAVRRLPPAARYPVRAADRVSDGARLLLASVAMYALSFVMEAVFGVGVPA